MNLPPSVLALLLAPLVAAPSPEPSPEPSSRRIAANLPPAVIVPPLSTGRIGPGRFHKVRFDGRELTLLDELRAGGLLVREEHYGAFAVAVIDERDFGGRDALQYTGLAFRDGYDVMALGAFSVDGLHPAQSLRQLDPAETLGAPADAIDAPLDPDAGLYVVQFHAPIRNEWPLLLESIGVTFAQYSPMNAYVVGLRPENVALLQSLATADPAIQFVDEYHPAYRMTPRHSHGGARVGRHAASCHDPGHRREQRARSG